MRKTDTEIQRHRASRELAFERAGDVDPSDPPTFGATEPEGGEHFENLSEGERWGSMIAGGACVAFGLSRKSIPGALLALFGAALFERGRSAHCPVYERLGLSSRDADGMELSLDEAITINRPRDQVYRFFRDLEQHPRFTKHLLLVSALGDGRSHWALKVPKGPLVEWDAEIVEEVAPELIRWRSLEGSDLTHHGEVWFEEAPGDRGTEVHVHWKYLPPGKTIGALVAKLAEDAITTVLKSELARLKQVIETGEVATVEGQPSGRTRVGEGPKRPAIPRPEPAAEGPRRVEAAAVLPE